MNARPACTHGLADPRMCPDCRRAARHSEPAAPVQKARGELVALGVAVRPDWNRAEIQAALVDADVIGLTWQQQLVGLARLMVDGHARPAELIPPHQRRTKPVDPDEVRAVYARGVEQARLLAERDKP
ncbi:hypothetical protein [Nonomuraea aridisoli]|uniref:Uncharacterized protein n=1 Tax=Nonomuraea aridisoli TaxID=2070368 RepID=A0A2W2EDP9_9ACTN|nr:hypothetical protein [Nonomuraea aridisoli]PZG20633.1 hypothetical protein C1J01_09020 [Nonomuraea aridisoli]